MTTDGMIEQVPKTAKVITLTRNKHCNRLKLNIALSSFDTGTENPDNLQQFSCFLICLP
jgi:hypothetical protein